MGEELSLKEKIDTIFEKIEGDNSKPIKTKPLKLPRKAKVRKRKLKKGWIGILKIDENGNIAGEKQQLKDSSIRTQDGLYHGSDGREILMWQGKFPVILQPSWKLNPITIKKESDKNETYGQPYVQARMIADTIKVKKVGGNIIIWLLVGAAVIFGLSQIL